MKCSEQPSASESTSRRGGPTMPDFYMPAVWPLDLQAKGLPSGKSGAGSVYAGACSG